MDEPINLELQNLPAESLLKIAFTPLDIVGIVEDGDLFVTTKIAADDRLFTKIHDIRDLNGAQIKGESLLSLLESETSGPWTNIDGTGGLSAEPLNGLLVIRQTERVHNEVEAVLADLRKQMAEAPKPKKAEPEDPQAVSTKFYALEASTDPESVQQAILTLVEPKSWAKNGGEGEMVLIGYQLVVKHKNEVQTQVNGFLKDLRKSIQSNSPGFGTNFHGGSGNWHKGATPAQPSTGGGFFDVPSGLNLSQPKKPATDNQPVSSAIGLP